MESFLENGFDHDTASKLAHFGFFYDKQSKDIICVLCGLTEKLVDNCVNLQSHFSKSESCHGRRQLWTTRINVSSEYQPPKHPEYEDWNER